MEINIKCEDQFISNNWAVYLGDSIELIKKLSDNSIGYSIFSPPFLDLYIYSDSERDLGNSKTHKEFWKHFSFLIKELYRVLQPGRCLSVHCSDVPIMKEKEGYIGLFDFPGDIIRNFQNCNNKTDEKGRVIKKQGFIKHSEVIIWKDPLIEATRTKSMGLLYGRLCVDSSVSRQGIPDKIITFKKPGENKNPIKHNIDEGLGSYQGKKEYAPTMEGIKYNHQVWQKYASPVWMDIRQTNTLQYRKARDGKDEKHICLAGDSLILTQRGYIPIKDIIINEDVVLTHKGNWKKVIVKKLTKKNANVIKINAIGVPNLICTESHKIFARRSKKYKPTDTMIKSNPEWIEANDLYGCYVNQKLPPIIETNLTSKDCWIIGRYLADGHIDYRKHQFFVSVGNRKMSEFKKIVGDNIGICVRKVGCYQIGLKKLKREVRDILKKCGFKAINKVLPIELISLNKELSMNLLEGYLSGDGHKDKFGRYHCTSISRGLLLGLSIIAQRIGIIASIYKGKKAGKRKIESRIVNCNQEWRMLLSKRNTWSRILNDGAWKKIRKIEEVDNCDVWNIQIEDDESYTAEGCIVKNCPLQLDVIHRCLLLWSNPKDIVLDPFNGIASTGDKCIELDRFYIGFELKESYYRESIKNLKRKERRKNSNILK